MNTSTKNIDILENTLRRTGHLLDILLFDKNTQNNIIWATDSYEKYGKDFSLKLCIKPELVTGKFGLLIQPRAVKSLEEQRKRTKEKAEVFTPLSVIAPMNNSIDRSNKFKKITKTNWQEYVRQIWIEITCGEGPFIVSRYDPTMHTREFVPLEKRVGFLDKKLNIVSRYCDSKKAWLFWAKEAFKASYGYEWQGDNILLARENLLYTLNDYYKAQFKQLPTLRIQEEFAEIISWNIFQMDGLKYVVPMSCHCEAPEIANKKNLFGTKLEKVEKDECEGCKYNLSNKHNGKYVKIMDWKNNKVVRFVDIIK